jgi:hypothetical protein
LAQAVTITRVMVVVVTIRLMILGSEGEIATQYVLWIRSMAAIGALHWCFASTPVLVRSWKDSRSQSDPAGADRSQGNAYFRNLLR